MNDLLKQEILKIVDENSLSVACSYTMISGDVHQRYFFVNYSDAFEYDEYFKKICDDNMTLNDIAEMVYSTLQIRYSQQNEFYLD
jgi:hypothetical protein